MRVVHFASAARVQCREGVFVFVHDFVGDCHRLLEIRIVGDRLKAAASELDHVKKLAALQIEALHQFAGQK
jgi:hypothetical protein